MSQNYEIWLLIKIVWDRSGWKKSFVIKSKENNGSVQLHVPTCENSTYISCKEKPLI